MSATVEELVREWAPKLIAAYGKGEPLPAPPSAVLPGFDLAAAYAIEAEVVRRRQAAGRRTTGLKVGFANKAMWRILKLETLVWAHMYDDTVHLSPSASASHDLGRRVAPRIEPEIVFKLRSAVDPGLTDPAAILAAVDWIAWGFEINDCVFPDWKFQPADFVAALGFHTALVVAPPRPVAPADADALARFTLRLTRNGELAEAGSGKNALRSPALCLGELATALARQPRTAPLAAGDLVSTGTLTTPQDVAAGERWQVEAEGLDLPVFSIGF